MSFSKEGFLERASQVISVLCGHEEERAGWADVTPFAEARLSRSLWDRVYAALEAHRQPTDADAQAALDRVAAKVLHLTERRSFNPSTCSIREEVLSLEQLRLLEVYHSRASPHRDDDTIVVFEHGERRYIVDGNNRVNAWLQSGNARACSAIVVTPTLGPGRRE